MTVAELKKVLEGLADDMPVAHLTDCGLENVNQAEVSQCHPLVDDGENANWADTFLMLSPPADIVPVLCLC